MTSFARENRKEYLRKVCPSYQTWTVTHDGDGFLAVLCRRQHRHVIPGWHLDASGFREVMELLPTHPKEEKTGSLYLRFALQRKGQKVYIKRNILVLLLSKLFIA